MFNSESKSFYDIPDFHELLGKNGYNDIVVPSCKRVNRYYDNIVDNIVDIDLGENPYFSPPKNYKFLKTITVEPEGYKEALEKQQAIYLSVTSLYFDMQKTVFTNCINDENFNLPLDTINNLFNIAYSNAYDRGHSAGYDEVNSYLNSETNKCIEYIQVLIKC